jgi:hypothetical protein
VPLRRRTSATGGYRTRNKSDPASILRIKTNIRERSLLVIGRDDEVLNEKIRQSRKSKDKNKRK